MDSMVLFEGAKERTLPEYTDLFRQSGFAAPRLIPTRSVFFDYGDDALTLIQKSGLADWGMGTTLYA
jgi:hypothetical protein